MIGPFTRPPRVLGSGSSWNGSPITNTTVVAAIGPVTAAAASALGVKALVVPDVYTVEGLVKALVEKFRPNS